MNRRLAWLAHPYGGQIENLARAKTWLRWCLRTFPQVDFVADWILWCELLNDGDPAERKRGLDFDVKMIERCDDYWMVGGVVSAGMATELGAARGLRKKVVDLLALGVEPPLPGEATWLTRFQDTEVYGYLVAHVAESVLDELQRSTGGL